MKKRFILAALSIYSTHTLASTGFKLETPTFNGTGCNANNTEIKVSPDQTNISVYFSGYKATAGLETGNSIASANCNLTIPVQMEPGYSLSVYKMDFNGFANIPDGALTKFKAEFFLPGSNRITVDKNINTSFYDSFSTSNTVGTEYWTECGKKELLLVNSSLLLKTNSAGDQASAEIDGVDLKSGLVYNFKVKRCGGPVEPQPTTVELNNYISSVYRDSYATTKNPPFSYQFDESLGYIFQNRQQNTAPLYSCLGRNYDGLKDHFANITCNGDRQIEVLGYLELSRTAQNRPIFMCTSFSGNRFLALSQSCYGNSDWDGTLIGYARYQR